MIHQDGQTAANQHHHKKEIEEVAVTHPDRKPVRPGEVVGIYLRNGWDMRQPGHGDLDPGRRDYRENRDTDSDQDGRSNPDAKSAIGRIMDGSVCRIERDHVASELSPARFHQHLLHYPQCNFNFPPAPRAFSSRRNQTL